MLGARVLVLAVVLVAVVAASTGSAQGDGPPLDFKSARVLEGLRNALAASGVDTAQLTAVMRDVEAGKLSHDEAADLMSDLLSEGRFKPRREHLGDVVVGGGEVADVADRAPAGFARFLRTHEVVVVAFAHGDELGAGTGAREELETLAARTPHAVFFAVHCQANRELCDHFDAQHYRFVVHRYQFVAKLTTAHALAKRTAPLFASSTPFALRDVRDVASAAAKCDVVLTAHLPPSRRRAHAVWDALLSYLATFAPPVPECTFFTSDEAAGAHFGIDGVGLQINTTHPHSSPTSTVVPFSNVSVVLEAYLANNLGPLSPTLPHTIRDYFARKLPLVWVFVDVASEATPPLLDALRPIAEEQLSLKHARFTVVDGNKLGALSRRYNVTQLPTVVVQSTVGGDQYPLEPQGSVVVETLGRFVDGFVAGECLLGLRDFDPLATLPLQGPSWLVGLLEHEQEGPVTFVGVCETAACDGSLEETQLARSLGALAVAARSTGAVFVRADASDVGLPDRLRAEGPAVWAVVPHDTRPRRMPTPSGAVHWAASVAKFVSGLVVDAVLPQLDRLVVQEPEQGTESPEAPAMQRHEEL